MAHCAQAKAKVAAHASWDFAFCYRTQEIFKLIDRESLINGLEPSGEKLEAGANIGRIERRGMGARDCVGRA